MHPTALKVQERLRERGLDVRVRVLHDSTRTAAETAAAGCAIGQIVSRSSSSSTECRRCASAPATGASTR